MAEKVNLRSSEVKRQKRRVAEYGTQTPLSSTAVERGTTRWLDGSNVVIEGLLDVTGTANVDGTLNVGGTANVSGLLDVTGTFNGSGTNNLDGTNNLSGTNNLTGPTDITGALTIAGSMDVTGPSTFAGTLGIDGDTTITGLLDITGDTTLTGNMDVLGGGKITVGNTILSPSAANGGVEFASGGGVGGNGGGVVMRGSANAGFMALSNTTSSMFAGASQIDVSNSLINLNAPQTSVNGNLVGTGTLDIAGTAWIRGLPTTGLPPNMHITSLGQVHISTWTP